MKAILVTISESVTNNDVKNHCIMNINNEERELKEERRRIKAKREIEKEEEAKKARKALGFY